MDHFGLTLRYASNVAINGECVQVHTMGIIFVTPKPSTYREIISFHNHWPETFNGHWLFTLHSSNGGGSRFRILWFHNGGKTIYIYDLAKLTCRENSALSETYSIKGLWRPIRSTSVERRMSQRLDPMHMQRRWYMKYSAKDRYRRDLNILRCNPDILVVAKGWRFGSPEKYGKGVWRWPLATFCGQRHQQGFLSFSRAPTACPTCLDFRQQPGFLWWIWLLQQWYRSCCSWTLVCTSEGCKFSLLSDQEDLWHSLYRIFARAHGSPASQTRTDWWEKYVAALVQVVRPGQEGPV